MLLVPGTQPEIQEMRTWLCDQVREQSQRGCRAGAVGGPDRHLAADDHRRLRRLGLPGGVRLAEALLATDEASVVIAVSASALHFLGFGDATDLVGRRVITIIPARFRQAHIAGTTLHVVNGRQPLLGVRVTVPVLLADGTEATTELLIEPRRRSAGRKVFIAEFFPLEARAAG